MGSIQETAAEIKEWLLPRLARGIGDWGLPALFVLVTFTAFCLGRLSAFAEYRPAVAIGQAPLDTKPRAMALGAQYVASKTGTVYYFPWCGGAQQIPAGKQVWFSSENAAQKAGYRPAKNCKGLANSQ